MHNITPEQLYSEYKLIKNVKAVAAKHKIQYNKLLKIFKHHNYNLYPKGFFNRKWDFNKNFFDIIDNEEKAYFLGFLWADGNNSGKSAVTLKISEKDKYILEKFKESIKSSRPLVHISNIKCQKNNKTFYCKDAYCLIINSKELCDKLTKIGMPPNKTKYLRLPFDLIPKNIFHHFIRGFFDGDGSLPKRIEKNRKKPSISFELCCKNFNLAIDLKNTFYKYTKINLSIRKDGSIYKIYSSNRKNIIKILKWIYKDANLKLNRKYDRYKQLILLEKEWAEKRTSNYKGISFDRKSKKWIVRKSYNKKIITIGRFDTEEKALIAIKLYNESQNIV